MAVESTSEEDAIVKQTMCKLLTTPPVFDLVMTSTNWSKGFSCVVCGGPLADHIGRGKWYWNTVDGKRLCAISVL